jgi:hypothetical protein
VQNHQARAAASDNCIGLFDPAARANLSHGDDTEKILVHDQGTILAPNQSVDQGRHHRRYPVQDLGENQWKDDFEHPAALTTTQACCSVLPDTEESYPMSKPSDLRETPQANAEEMKFNYSKAVHVVGEAFQINVDPNGTVKIAFAATGMEPSCADVQAIAHIPPTMMEPLVNAICMVANRMRIKIHNTVQ